MTVSVKTVTTSHADIAVSESAGDGLPVVLIHGNSANRKVFDGLMNGPVGQRHRLIAVDLPGHGDSSDAHDPERTYTFTGYAEAVTEALGELGVDRAALLGWSLGGHVAMEMSAIFPGTVGAMVIGAPPVGRTPEEVPLGFQPTPHVQLPGKFEFTEEEAAIFAFATYGDPQSAAAHAAFARTDGRARQIMFTGLFTGKLSDERKIVETSPVPFAIVNGENDPLVNLDYVGSLNYANLWDEHCFVLRGAGHAPFMQTPELFNGIFERFVDDMAKRPVTATTERSSASAA